MVKELEKLRYSKAAGADELTTRFLDSVKGGTVYHITSPCMLFFGKYCRTSKGLKTGLKLTWYQSLREWIRSYHQTIRLTSLISKF